MSVSGLILAAGASSRMGSPKPLLQYRGRTFIETLTSLLLAHCDEVIVVAGAHADLLAAHIGPSARMVVNTEWALGQTSSLQCGLRALNVSTEGVLMTLADHPAVAATTVVELLAAPWPLVRVPRHDGRRGHPVWFHRELFAEFLALGPEQGAREVVRAHDLETELVDVDDPGVLADIDDSAAYARLLLNR